MTRPPFDPNTYQSLPELRTARRLNERIDATRIVFRVFDSSSFRGYDPATGFEATGFNNETNLSYARLADAHLDRDNRTIITPWLSTSRRWLWAVWDMNRRFHWPNSRGLVVKRDSIRVAVIDLNACKGTPFPPVHSLSLLSPTSERRDFANISDEILIYGKIPPAAIISIWRFEKSIDIVGIPRTISEGMPTVTYKGYREVHHNLVNMLESHSLAQTWQASEEGRRYASIVINMMQYGYHCLERQLDKMLAPVTGTRLDGYEQRSCSINMNSLIKEMSTFSTGGASDPSNVGVHGSGIPQPTKAEDRYMSLKNVAVKFRRTFKRTRQDESMAKKPVNTQIESYEASIIPLARQKIEDFRGIALEFARTTPLGLVDQSNIGPHDWAVMKRCMIEHVDAWLAPLEKKLEGLEDRAVSALISRAKTGWLEAEERYPQWWEPWGTQSTIDNIDPPRGRHYTYLATGTYQR
ncbi:unnamed protein product [Rhizoctonia solani]|uniref:DUF7587 domain-containing protein n=1 Tax=Rhizoctonia solani TaxID=456999 RepID=A0A8H3C037_9AGAM|nr:unnamed protein product [Rhizoctonia solani]